MMEPTYLSSVDDCIMVLEVLVKCLKKPLPPPVHKEEVGSLQLQAAKTSLALLNYFLKEYNEELSRSFNESIKSSN